MKITYLANIRLPTKKAHGIQIMKTCEALARNGAEVSLVVTGRKTDVSEDPFLYYKVEKNFNIYYGYCPDLVVWGKIGFFLMNAIFSQSCAHYVWKLKPDIVYSRDSFLLLDQWLWPQKKVLEVHDGVWSIVTRLMRISGIVAISSGLKDFYYKKGIKKIVVAHDAVNLKEFETNEKADLGLSMDKKAVVYIGNLYGWKGLDSFLGASKYVLQAQFVVIGGTNEEVDKLKTIHTNVKFLGYKPYKELAKNQKAADVLVIPNSGKSDISRLYTSPLKVFSYMTSGVPIVASDLPSLREILNENNAYFAKPDNAQSFGKVIQEVLDNPVLAKEKADQALLDVQKYTWENRAKTILGFLKSF
jgi:glycosyltransferase involved in cell wall biosynthesis